MDEYLWSQIKRERDKKKERIRSEGKELEVAGLTVCQQGFVCQYSTAPRHCSRASWLWPKTHTHSLTYRFRHTYPRSMSLYLSLSLTHTHTNVCLMCDARVTVMFTVQYSYCGRRCLLLLYYYTV